MTILETILAHKRREVESRKELYPTKLLEKSIFFDSTPVSLKRYLQREDLVGIIAEIKRKSPSKGYFQSNISVEQLSIGYMQAGASALSVLTDTEFFGGNSEDLRVARRFNFCPILRKDFMIDEYQIIEAKSIGADAILLIASALSPEEVKRLATLAHSLKLEVLLEVHDETELSRSLCDDIDVVGVNNRNLADFSVDIERSTALSEKIPGHLLKISESGIDNAATIRRLKTFGFRGFLIGETFMKTSKPARTCAKLVADVRSEA